MGARLVPRQDCPTVSVTQISDEPRLTTHVAQLSWPNQMPDQSDDSERNAEDGSGDVGPSEERLFTSDPRDGRDDNALCAGELLDRIV